MQEKCSRQLSVVRCSEIASTQCSASGMRQYEVVNFYYSQQRWLILKLPSELVSSLFLFPSFCRCASYSLRALVFLSFREYRGLRQCMRGLAQNQYRIWRGSNNEFFLFPPLFFFPFLFSSFFYRLLLVSSSNSAGAARVLMLSSVRGGATIA